MKKMTQQDAYYKSQENLFSGPVAFFENESDLLGCDAVLSGGVYLFIFRVKV
jgi:hypothetical protein